VRNPLPLFLRTTTFSTVDNSERPEKQLAQLPPKPRQFRTDYGVLNSKFEVRCRRSASFSSRDRSYAFFRNAFLAGLATAGAGAAAAWV
jgi:hypothetical protein